MNMLRTLRERKGFTVSQLASRASIPARVIMDYEEGRQALPLAHARVLAKALWVGVDELMPPGGSAPVSPPAAPPVSPGRSNAAPASGESARPPYAAGPVTRSTSPPRSAQPRHAGDERDHKDDHGGQKGPVRPARTRPAPPPPSPISQGQVEEVVRLAARMEVTPEQLEGQFGKPLLELTRPEAKEWIKRLRAMVDEIAPSQRVRYGQWPNEEEDREALYLQEQREAGALFTFKLFNGEEFAGTISDFTPYTVTVKNTGTAGEVVLRKLAIAYYRKTGEGSGRQDSGSSAHDHGRDDAHQPLDAGTDPDRAGSPETPEEDAMDEDRGL